MGRSRGAGRVVDTVLGGVGNPDYWELAQWGAVLLLGLVVMVVVAAWYRRRYRAETSPRSRPTWTLDDLAAMRRRGNVNDEEYARLRERVLRDMGVSGRKEK